MKSHLYRRPEFEKHYNEASWSLWCERSAVNVCSPFPPYQLPRPIDWFANPFSSDTWCMYFSLVPWFYTLDYGIQHHPDSPEAVGARQRLVDDVAALISFCSGRDESSFPKMFWFDHATAWRASTLAYISSRYEKDIAKADVALELKELLRTHCLRLTEFIASGKWNSSNHGIFHAEALADISIALEDDPNAEYWLSLAVSHAQPVSQALYDWDEGVCKEQSLYYHDFDFALLAESGAFFHQLGTSPYEGLDELKPKAKSFLERCSPFGGPLWAIGDTAFGRQRSNHYLLRDEPAGPDPEGHAMYAYPNSGYLFFANSYYVAGAPERDAAVLLAKPFMGTHGHIDGGAVLVQRNGQEVLCDSGGPFGYGHPLRHQYFTSAYAHNVVLVNRTSCRYLAHLIGSGESDQLRWGVVRADLGDTEWYRMCVSAGKGHYFIFDALNAPVESRFSALFHFAPGSRPHCDDLDNVWLLPLRQTFALMKFVSTANSLTTIEGFGDEQEFPRSWITTANAQKQATRCIAVEIEGTSELLVSALSFHDPAEVHIERDGEAYAVHITSDAWSGQISLDLANSNKPAFICR